MRRRRMGRPGLVGTMARTAVVAGTATAVAGSVHQHQAAKADAAQGGQVVEQAPPPPPPPAPVAAAPQDDMIAQLTKLSELKTAGVLSEEEFTAAKAKLLG